MLYMNVSSLFTFSCILRLNRIHYQYQLYIFEHIELFNILKMRMKLLSTFVLFTLFYLSYARYSRVKRVFVCEGKTLTLSCKYNQGIKILYATYGRKNSTICTEDSEEEEGSQVEMNLDCRSHNATNIIKQKCSFKTNCSVEINSDVFGDSCPGTRKYSFVKYKCIQKSRPTRKQRHFSRRNSKVHVLRKSYRPQNDKSLKFEKQ